jgi:hypothetical protein
MSKSAEDGAGGGFAGEMVLKELKEKLADYLCFVSTHWVVCDVCGDKLRVRDLPEHVEYVHYDPPTRVWSKGPTAGWRRRWRQL